MEVILLEKVQNLGDLGDTVNVKSGYARNFLLPSRKATIASEENKKIFEERRAELERVAAEKLAEAQKRKESLDAVEVTIAAKAGDEGKLFGSVGVAEIADAITEKGVEVEKREVTMPEGPIRLTGEYEIVLQLHTDVDVTIKVTVVAE